MVYSWWRIARINGLLLVMVMVVVVVVVVVMLSVKQILYLI